MTSEIGGGDTYILSADPNSGGITVLSGTGPAGPAGPAGPVGPAFQGNAIALINPETGEAYLPGEALLVTGTLDVEIPPITIPPIDIEFPDQINANVVNWPASTLVMVGNDEPIEVTIAGGVSQFDGQLVQGGQPVSATNRLFTNTTLSADTVLKGIADAVDVNILSGGSTFDGQLSQGGVAVSDANPLSTKIIGSVTVANQPTSIAISNHPTNQTVTVSNPTTTVAVSNLPATQPVSLAAPISLATGTEVGITGLVGVAGTVSLDGPISITPGTSVGAKLELSTGPGAGMPISDNVGLPVKPANGAVFRIGPSFGEVLSVAIQNTEVAVTLAQPVTINSSTPVDVNIVSGGGGSSVVTPIDRSGTITTGGSAQTLMASNSARKGFWLQNLSSGDLYFSVTGTASATAGIKLGAGSLYEAPPSGVAGTAVSIFGATDGQAFSSNEW